MRKVLAAAMLAAVLVLAGNAVEASQVPITKIDNEPVYLLTETVQIKTRDPLAFTCKVVFQQTEVEYEFFPKNGETYYSVEEGVEYRLKNYPYSIPDFAYKYVVAHY